MAYGMGRFAVSVSLSTILIGVLLFSVLSSKVAMALPLMDVLGIGGFYFSAQSFQGETAKLYPVQGTDTVGADTDPDTPVCEQRPMIAIELANASIEGFFVRKDIQLPHLSDRWMSIQIRQPFGGRIEASNVTFYTTQLDVDRLKIRNVLIREARPGESDSAGPRIEPQNQNVPGQVTNDKFGQYSGEFYLEGGNAPNKPGLKASDESEDVDSIAAAAWLHSVTAREISIINPGFGLIEVDVSFPTNTRVQNYYESRLGYSGPEDFGQFERDKYFDCLPVEITSEP